MTDSEEPQIPHWPGDWPGRQVVDLDNVGDPGYWIEEQIPDPEELLQGEPAEWDQGESVLADAYIHAAEELCFPLPSDFDVNDEECREMVKEEFRGFLMEWRKRMQSSREGGG